MSRLNLIFILSLFLFVRQSQTFYSSFVASSNLSRINSLNSHLSQVEHDSDNGTLAVDLPVSYKSFIAKRLSTKVDLVWETTKEYNNTGFEVQRRMGNGEWQKVAFVFSQAADGNSNNELTYEYTDVNTMKAESQYRLRQVDKDQQTSFSEVKSIKGY